MPQLNFLHFQDHIILILIILFSIYIYIYRGYVPIIGIKNYHKILIYKKREIFGIPLIKINIYTFILYCQYLITTQKEWVIKIVINKIFLVKNILIKKIKTYKSDISICYY